MMRVSDYRSRRLGFDFQRYQIFRVAVVLEWGVLSPVRITEELVGGNSSGFGIENRQ
jgi:hypothetical protein